MRSTPYVGITGFMSADEVEQCLDAIPQESERKLMVGVLSSSKTVTGQTNSSGNKFPKREDYSRIFINDSQAFNCFHFGNPLPGQLYDHLMLMLEYGAGLADGIQLNVVWPDEEDLRKVKTQYPQIKFILQVSPHLIGYSIMKPQQIGWRIKSIYGDLIDYVIVDFSRGLGLKMPIDDVRLYLSAIIKENPKILPAVGGGLNGQNVRRIMSELVAEFPNISPDAENRLRDDSPAGGKLIIEEAQLYTDEAFEGLEPYN